MRLSESHRLSRGECEQVSKDLWDAKDALSANKPEDALGLLQDALKITDELTDKRARRAVLRVTVRSAVQSRSERQTHNLQACSVHVESCDDVCVP